MRCFTGFHRSQIRRITIRTIAIVALFPLLVGLARTGRAAENIQTKMANDLRMLVDTRWAGGSHGGYFPIRIRVTNLGETRDLTFRFEPSNGDNPTVLRTLTADQNATLEFSLSVPLVGNGFSGELDVLEDGDELEELQTSIDLPRPDSNSVPVPSILVISNKAPNTANCGLGCGLFGAQNALSGRHQAASQADVKTVPAEILPTSWLDYTTLDCVVISRETFNAIPSGQQQALLMWTRAGGTLILDELQEKPVQSPFLKKVLQLDEALAATSWFVPNAASRPEIALHQPIGNRREWQVINGRRRMVEVPNLVRMPQDDQRNEQSRWTQADPFSLLRLGAGTVIAFEDSAFPGSARDWNWVMTSLTNVVEPGEPASQRPIWISRNGHSARTPASDFMKFLIPGVETVPVYAFLFLISIFTIVIGPLNYWFLWKRKQLYLLVLSIPVIAVVTSLVLFGYSTIAHGLGVRSRIRSMTLLDQRTHQAVSMSRVSLYAGMSPSEGLKFSRDSAVFPIYNDDQEHEGGTLDWTDRQAMRSGWLPSRTMTQFQVTTPREIRGRLNIGAPANDSLEVANGLEWNIKSIVICGDDGQLYAGENLAADGSSTLPLARDLQLVTLAQIINSEPDGLPKNLEHRRSIFDGFSNRRYYHRRETSMSNSVMEAHISAILRISTQPILKPRSFVAILEDNPGIEVGVEETSETGSLHLLRGVY
ncbi:MAG: hypothetical protein O3A00_05335 [Planctomycetota bacterium]|nr:hypothetical protein [Planctomycetota bacterium]